MFSNNYLGLFSQKRRQLLSTSIFKRVYYIEKKVIRHVNENLSAFSDESDEEWFFL